MATSVGESMLGCPKIQIQISNKLFNLFNYIWPKKFTKSNIQKFRKLYSHDFFLSGFYRVLSNFTVEVNMPRAPVGATKIFFNEIIIFCNTIVACERRNSRDDICILTVTLATVVKSSYKTSKTVIEMDSKNIVIITHKSEQLLSITLQMFCEIF